MDIFIESPRGVLVGILRNTLRFIAPRACDRYMREGTTRRRDTRFARVRAYAKDKTDTFFLREIASKPLAWGNLIEYHDRKREREEVKKLSTCRNVPKLKTNFLTSSSFSQRCRVIRVKKRISPEILLKHNSPDTLTVDLLVLAEFR